MYKLLSVLFFLGTLGCQVVVVVVFFFFFWICEPQQLLVVCISFPFHVLSSPPFLFFFFSKSWDMVPGDSLCGRSRANYYSDCAPT